MIKFLIVGLIILMYGFDLFVTLINYRHRTQPVPAIAANIYDNEKYHKWLAYFMENMRLRVIIKTISTVFLVILLLSGFFGFLERLTTQWFSHPIIQTLAFLAVFGLITTLISLPFDAYATFVIEEKYGFNKTTLKTFILDFLKNLALILFLGGGLVALINWIYLQFVGRIGLFILIAWLVITLVTLILFVLNTKVFVKIFNKLTPLAEGSLRDSIQVLAEKFGFNINAISVMDASKRSTKLNAFFSGLGKTREVVLYDTLLEKLEEENVLFVLAHELGHALHKDVPRLLIQQVLIFAFYAVVLGLILQSDALAQAFGLSGAQLGFGILLFSILISPLNLLISIPLNALSRKAEYAADAFAARQVGKRASQDAFRILAQENLANLTPHPLYVWLHYDHPSTPQRLQAIEDLEL
jgi:STE24 endopeptidase